MSPGPEMAESGGVDNLEVREGQLQGVPLGSRTSEATLSSFYMIDVAAKHSCNKKTIQYQQTSTHFRIGSIPTIHPRNHQVVLMSSSADAPHISFQLRLLHKEETQLRWGRPKPFDIGDVIGHSLRPFLHILPT